MTPEEFQLINECVGGHRKPYYYFRDKYALELARLLCEEKEEIKIRDLKRSRFAFLLNKEPVKKIVSQTGRDTLTSDDVDTNKYNSHGKGFWYTISRWGEFKPHRNDGYYQTSRPGLNLVLQLNFDEDHNRFYNQLIKPDKDDHPFAYTSHPVLISGEYTLSWARLDISLETGEVLIEEIQNDWLREAMRILSMLEEWDRDGRDVSRYWVLERSSLRALRKYIHDVLKPYLKVWDEAMLNLAIQFCKKELGLNGIYYHTYESGKYLKGYSDYSLPPRSIYTTLPRKFGFAETGEAPEFIRKEKYLRKKLRRRSVNWFRLLL